ncbi:hypothetical protein [Streptomyces sp. NPDC053755]|uniref:hypothetical protein n=1 Tax=Streptomyces sp. NPDC053755 TaxID=3155815 RepID=UPI0034481F2E
MTQSGQGPEPQYPPAVRPAHEGVVLPAEGSTDGGPAAGPAGGQPWGGSWGPGGGRQGGGQPLPPAQPLPPETVPGGGADMQATQYIAPVPPQAGQPGPMPGTSPGQAAGYGAIPGAHPQQSSSPLPPQGGYGYPQTGAGPGTDGRGQQSSSPLPPQGGYGYPQAAPGHAADMQATQHIPPVAAQGGGSDTQFLGTGPLHQQPAGASDATQYIAPVPSSMPGERQPPAEFDNLFRSDATQHLPQSPQHHQAQPPPHQPPYGNQPPAPQGPQPPQPYGFQDAYYDGDDEPAPRRKSPVGLIAAVVVGCAIVGLGAGALLSGGDEDKDKKPGQNVAASSGAPSTGPSDKPADPAEPQAQALDKLLADSNDSRDAVIRSVESIKQCKNLDQAATDLKGAAAQRRDLVTRLEGLSVDKLPDNAALTAALTKAWQASASADDHYAAWAVQAKSKKVCKGGKARGTSQTVEATKKSGEATTAKREAAGLWNPTAKKYGLPQRTPTQL